MGVHVGNETMYADITRYGDTPLTRDVYHLDYFDTDTNTDT